VHKGEGDSSYSSSLTVQASEKFREKPGRAIGSEEQEAKRLSAGASKSIRQSQKEYREYGDAGEVVRDAVDKL